ncbi:hypothetical protein [Levilactobacillus namurensis]|uniref:hypothetical protein n=1 Tax=Levilactobacillus namurensis TaxID=380393 RepID=UPI0026E9AD76|nr:hypothetical protein [Levilactobacillus namurensis]
MKPTVKTITGISIVSAILFMVANTLTQLSMITTDYRPLINSLGFAVLLYAWALLGIWRKRRFAMGFLDFINIVYTFGFISTLISGSGLITIIVSVTGLMVNIYLFVLCRQSRQRLRSQNIG